MKKYIQRKTRDRLQESTESYYLITYKLIYLNFHSYERSVNMNVVNFRNITCNGKVLAIMSESLEPHTQSTNQLTIFVVR